MNDGRAMALDAGKITEKEWMQNHVRSMMKPRMAPWNERRQSYGTGCRQNHGKGMEIETNKAF